MVSLEGPHAEELSASLDEYMERRQSSDIQGHNVTEDGLEDEFSDNASTSESYQMHVVYLQSLYPSSTDYFPAELSSC